MRTIVHVGAVLAALSCSLTTLVAQQSAVERIAQAKLHDSRGDLALAEQDLRTALTLATPAEREQVTKALAALLVRQGRNDEAAALTKAEPQQEPQQPASGQDPIQRLIGLLDSGAGTSEPAKDAIAQLGTLGVLAVPPLLAALPKLGPFGTRNALELLNDHDDERVFTVLAQLAETADPAIVATIADRVRSFRRGVALPLAQKLAEPRFPVGVRCRALGALVAHGGAEADVRALALKLAADPSGDTSRRLYETLHDASEPWVVDVFAVLKDRGSPNDRATALVLWLQRQKGVGEELALSELAKLAPEVVPPCARSLVLVNPSWVRVGMLGFEEGDNADGSWWFAKVEWWRLPDECAPLLLRQVTQGRGRAGPQGGRPNQYYTHVATAIQEMTARGWKAPMGLDSALAELAQAVGNFDTFVAALPVDAEERALVVWSGQPPRWAANLADCAVLRGERPWHRLAMKQLLSAPRADQVERSLLDRDWSGAPPDVVEQLVELAKRWPRSATGGELPWHATYVNAFSRCRNLPVTGLLPLLGTPGQLSMHAWNVIARDPPVAFEYARGAATLPPGIAYSLLELVPEHGGAKDVSLALRAFESLRNQNLPSLTGLVAFLGRHGAGNLEVVALARTPLPASSERDSWLRIARQAARGVRIQDLAEALALLPELHVECAGDLVRTIEPQLTAEHGALLARAIEARLAEPLRYDNGDGWNQPIASASVLRWLVQSLGKVGDAAAAPLLQRVVAHANPDSVLVTDAARAMLQVAGSGRRELLLEMLRSPKLPVACAALDAAELRTDAELRSAARATVLRLGEQDLMSRVDPFRVLDEPDRFAFATAILESETFPRLDDDLARSALQVLGARKDPALVPTLLRGAAHREAGVRVAVATQLGMTFSREAAAPLLEMLKDDRDMVRKAAQEALDQIANYLDARAKWEARLK